MCQQNCQVLIVKVWPKKVKEEAAKKATAVQARATGTAQELRAAQSNSTLRTLTAGAANCAPHIKERSYAPAMPLAVSLRCLVLCCHSPLLVINFMRFDIFISWILLSSTLHCLAHLRSSGCPIQWLPRAGLVTSNKCLLPNEDAFPLTALKHHGECARTLSESATICRPAGYSQ